MSVKYFLSACLVLVSLCQSLSANIIGSDDRVPMMNNQLPWSAIGRIQIGTSGICTGTLVAKDIILTAAHCFLENGSGAEITALKTFSPSFQNGQSIHTARIVNIWYGTRNPKAEPWNDFALARLDSPLGEYYGTLSIANSNGSLIDIYGPQIVTLPGYSGDFLNAQTAGVHVGCFLKELIKGEGDQRLMGHDCDMRPGSSGGPMIAFQGQKTIIIGVNIAEMNYMISVSRLLNIPLEYNSRTSANLAVTTEKAYRLLKLLTGTVSRRL